MISPVCRTATPAEVALMLDWAAAEGWNPGLEDAAAFCAADPGGFFVAEVDDAPAAAISVVNHSPEMAFLGLYICKPPYRGQGIGMALWHHALAHAGTRTVGLDGVAAQQVNYARSGFVRAGASVRYGGALPALNDVAVRPATADDSTALARLDLAANGYARPAFLAAWTAPAETRQTLVLQDGDSATGFASVRRCREGVKIGPVVAPGTEDAMRLIGAAVAALPASAAIIDVPSDNQPLIAALAAAGCIETFATARMYRGPAPVAGPGLQAIGTMELG